MRLILKTIKACSYLNFRVEDNMNRTLTIGVAIVAAILLISLLGAYLVSHRPDSIGEGKKVAVIKLEGTIEMSSPEGGLFSTQAATPKSFRNKLEKATDDSSVKAIVIYVNSPGGSVVASEEMSRAIKEAKEKKPVVAWLGELATSGGYFVASASNYIVADPATITGSIGVISIFPEYSKLLKKFGLNMTVIKAGRYKDFSTGYRPMSEEERAMMQGLVNSTYEIFLREVSQNRNLSQSYVREVAGGRIYSGGEAVELKLADEVGGFETATRKAAELGGIEGEPQLVTYERPSFFREILWGSFESFGYGFARGLKAGEGEVRF